MASVEGRASVTHAELRKIQGLPEAADPSKLRAISDHEPWLREGLQRLDLTGDGMLDEEELGCAMKKMMEHYKAVAENSPVFDYTQLPGPIRDVMSTWDKNGDGNVHVSELVKAAEAQMEITKPNRNQKWILLLALLVLLAFPLLNLLTQYVAILSSKDMKLSTTGRLTTNDAARRTLQDLAEADLSNTDNLVATQSGSTQGYLSSTMSNTDLRELRSITISAGADTANAGFVELEVVARMREETVTAKCGSVVHLDTVAGRVTLDDTSIFLSPEVLDAVTNSMGHDAARRLLGEQNHGPARRLSDASDVVGYFNKLSHAKYECSSVERPGMNFLNYMYTARVDFPCDDLQGCTSDLANYLGVSYLPGVFETETGEKKIAVEQTGWVFGDEQITKSQYPNHPFQELWELATPLYTISFQVVHGGLVHCIKQHKTSDHADEGPQKLLRKLAGQINQVSQEDIARQLQEAEAETANDLYIQFLGRSVDYSLLDEGVAIRKFKIRPKNETVAVQKHLPPAEYWDRDVAGSHLPYRVVLGGDELAPKVTATTFTDVTELDEASWVQIRSEIPDDLGDLGIADPRCSTGGSNLRHADVPIIKTPGEERLSSVQWYYEYFYQDYRRMESENGTRATRAQVGGVYGDYWMHVYGHDDQTTWGDNAFVRYMSEKLSLPVAQMAYGVASLPAHDQVREGETSTFETAMENLDGVDQAAGTARRQLHPWENTMWPADLLNATGAAPGWLVDPNYTGTAATPFELRWVNGRAAATWGASMAQGNFLERGMLIRQCDDPDLPWACIPGHGVDYRYGVTGFAINYHGCREFTPRCLEGSSGTQYWGCRVASLLSDMPVTMYICNASAPIRAARFHEHVIPDDAMHPGQITGFTPGGYRMAGGKQFAEYYMDGNTIRYGNAGCDTVGQDDVDSVDLACNDDRDLPAIAQRPWNSGLTDNKMYYISVSLKCGGATLNRLGSSMRQRMGSNATNPSTQNAAADEVGGCTFGNWVITAGAEGAYESGVEEDPAFAIEDCGPQPPLAYEFRYERKGCSNHGSILLFSYNGKDTESLCEGACAASDSCTSYSWHRSSGLCHLYSGDCNFANNRNYNAARGKYNVAEMTYEYATRNVHGGWRGAARGRNGAASATGLTCQSRCDAQAPCRSYTWQQGGSRCVLANNVPHIDSNPNFYGATGRETNSAAGATSAAPASSESAVTCGEPLPRDHPDAEQVNEQCEGTTQEEYEAYRAGAVNAGTSGGCTTTQPAYFRASFRIWLGVMRSFNLFTWPWNCRGPSMSESGGMSGGTCSTYVGCFFGLKFQVIVAVGGSTEEGSQSSALGFRVTLGLGLTVYGGCGLKLMGYDFAGVTLSANITLFLRLYPLKRYFPSLCVLGILPWAVLACMLFAQLFHEGDWYQFDMEGNFYVEIRIQVGRVIMFKGRVDGFLWLTDFTQNIESIPSYTSWRAWSPGIQWASACGLDFSGWRPVTRCGFGRPGITWRRIGSTNYNNQSCLWEIHAGACPPGYDPRRRLAAAPESQNALASIDGQLQALTNPDHARSAWFLEHYRRTEQAQNDGAARRRLAQVEEDFAPVDSGDAIKAHERRARILQEYFRRNAEPFQDPTSEDAEDVYQPLVASRSGKLRSLKSLATQFRK